MPRFLPFFRRARPSLETHFVTPDFGNLVMLRLAAFVQDHRATVREIAPNRAVLEMGGPTLSDRVFSRPFIPPVRLEFAFSDVDARRPATPNRETAVDVKITPRSRRSPKFDQMAKFVCRELRGYFAAV